MARSGKMRDRRDECRQQEGTKHAPGHPFRYDRLEYAICGRNELAGERDPLGFIGVEQFGRSSASDYIG